MTIGEQAVETISKEELTNFIKENKAEFLEKYGVEKIDFAKPIQLLQQSYTTE